MTFGTHGTFAIKNRCSKNLHQSSKKLVGTDFDQFLAGAEKYNKKNDGNYLLLLSPTVSHPDVK